MPPTHQQNDTGEEGQLKYFPLKIHYYLGKKQHSKTKEKVNKGYTAPNGTVNLADFEFKEQHLS